MSPVQLKNSTKETLNEVLLESKLNTKILGYDIIRTAPTPAFRIKEIGHVAWLIADAPHKTLPVLKSSKTHKNSGTGHYLKTMCKKQGSMESLEWRGQAL